MKFTVSIFLAALFLCTSIFGQTAPSNENYVLQTSYQQPHTQAQIENQNYTVPNDHKIENIFYYDGLGRPKQSVAIRAGGNREDLVTPILYDPLGRQPREFLPLPLADNYGTFNNNTTIVGQPGVLHNLVVYYENKFPADSPDGIIPNVEINPYSVKRFESSPLNRLLEQAAPGDPWRLDAGSDTDHTIKFEYATNLGTEVRRFYVTYPIPGSNETQLHLESSNFGNYPAQTLVKTVTKDENWQPSDGTTGITIEFSNKLGQVVLKRQRVFDPERGSGPDYSYNVDTYYVYDDYGSLVFVISPEGGDKLVANNALIANPKPILDNLCYQYRYDYRNRLVWKKIPGKGYETILYNPLNRPILTQDANMREEDPNKYLFTKYDGLGRVAYTGFYTAAIPRPAIEDSLQNRIPASIFENQRTASQGSVQIGDTQVFYSNSSFPYDNLHVLTINYYDEYIDHIPGSLPTVVNGQYTTEHISVGTTVQGLPTVGKVRVLGTDDWITSLTAYDSKGRPIYSDSKNEYLESRDIVKSNLHFFTGRVEETHTVHTKTGQTGVSLHDYFTYDHMGRLLTQEQQITGSPAQLIAKNTYDELGQLTRKKVGGETAVDGYTDIDNIDVTFDGILTHTTSDCYWPSRLKTRGKIIDDGGISFKVEGTNNHTRVGLVKTYSPNTDNEDLDYGFYLRNVNNVYKVYIVNNGSDQSTALVYAPGDTFKVERVGTQVKYYHNSTTAFATVNYVGNKELLTGKVAFSCSGGSISQLALYGPKIDKILQKVDYRYNIRGWLTDINNVGNQPEGLLELDDDLFHFRINYNNLNGNPGNMPLFNGNIAQTLWRTSNADVKVRGYAYTYDDLNRITQAQSYKGATLDVLASNTEYTLDGVKFDKNGNILALKRWGADDNIVPTFGQWDDLTFEYEIGGNKLLKVIENSPSFTHRDFGFKDGGNTHSDYSYDDNGNMVQDLNKGIYNITYNHLNLPEVIYFDDQSSIPAIHYVYDATGVKLSKSVIEEGTIKTEYAGGFIYNNADTGQFKLQFFTHPEGYVKPVANTYESVDGFDSVTGTGTQSSYSYVFQYKDHLGNVRLSYSDGNLDGAINPATEIIEENNYYPFGLQQKGYNTNVSPSGNALAQQWSFNGKEFSQDLQLNSYDFGARNYDPALGRWMNIDPHAENYFSISPYVSFANNPISFVDPTGRDISFWKLNNKTGEWETATYEELDEKTQKSLEAFAKTDIGNKFLGQFAKKGDKIGEVEFGADGEYSNHELAFGETNKWYKPDGFSDVESKNGKLVFEMGVNQASKRELNKVENLAMSNGHEAFIHMERYLDKLIEAFDAGDMARVDQIIKEEVKKTKGTESVRNIIDHSGYINGNPEYNRMRTYQTQLKQVLNPQAVRQAIIDQDEKFKNLKKQ